MKVEELLAIGTWNVKDAVKKTMEKVRSFKVNYDPENRGMLLEYFHPNTGKHDKIQLKFDLSSKPDYISGKRGMIYKETLPNKHFLASHKLLTIRLESKQQG